MQSDGGNAGPLVARGYLRLERRECVGREGELGTIARPLPTSVPRAPAAPAVVKLRSSSPLPSHTVGVSRRTRHSHSQVWTGGGDERHWRCGRSLVGSLLRLKVFGFLVAVVDMLFADRAVAQE